ncbi:MAG: phosphoribosylaminoimidazolesuccinocarboxamide synthase, partial [Atribacterota bacterium]
MGSVKDLFVLSSPRDDIMGQGKFVFSDRYSVFDWGEMPDHIAGKGQSLCLIGAYFFEKLEELGYQTHYLGLEENGQWKKLQDLQAPSNVMGVKLVRVIHPTQMGETYDYGVYHRENNNFLIPFEFIYRNSLPAGSSFRRRVGDKTIRLDDYGLKSLPPDDEILTSPILDVSTKLEEQDRYLSWKDVLMVGILNEDDVDAIQLALRFANDLISREVASIGLRNEDGKIELAFNPHQELIFVDVVGTPDECR